MLTKVLRIEPGVGVGPILLGESRPVVREVLSNLGFPLESTRGSLDYFCGASIQVEFGVDDRADFIGLSWHGAYKLTYYEIDVFDTEARRLFELVAEHENSGGDHHRFDTAEYIFPGQILTLWEADEQYDHMGSGQRLIWAQVGIGSRRYLAAVQGA